MNNSVSFELINIDRENQQYNRVSLESRTPDLSDYILNARKTIIEESESRVYKLSSATTEVYTAVKSIFESDKNIGNESEVIAKRLLRIEIETQNRYDHIADIKKGSLFISKFTIDDIVNILIVKIEHTPFIDESDFKKHIGLPFKNEVLKSCLYQFNSDAELLSIMAHDSNGIVAAYWWNSFLELIAVSSDEQNTLIAFTALDQYLGRNVKSKSPADYTLIRNNLIGYFKTKESFGVHDMVNYIIGSYKPISEEIKIDVLKNDILELQKKKKFDASFSIVSTEVKARMKNIIKVNSNIELRIQDFAIDLKSIIHSELGEDGKKYLIILADDDAYERFSF